MSTMNHTGDSPRNAVTNPDLKLTHKLGMNARQEAALLQIGFRFYQQGRFVDARNVFEGLALLDENNPYAHGILGSLYQREGRDEEAIASYTAAIRLYGGDVDSHANRGELYLKLGRFPEAAKDFASAIQLDPSRKNPAANRSRLLVAITQDTLKLGQEKGVEAVEQERSRLGKLRRGGKP